MLTTTFGVTVIYLQYLHHRMLREHVSFSGEADVARAMEAACGTEARLPGRLRLYLSHAWFLWRLLMRQDEARRRHASGEFRSPSTSRAEPEGEDVDLLLPIEIALQRFYPSWEALFHSVTAKEARDNGHRTDLQVIDGNAKNRRTVCAAALRHKIECTTLRTGVRVCCPRTPLLGSMFCSVHLPDASGADVALDYDIVDHDRPGAAQPDVHQTLQLLVREKATDGQGHGHREFWIEEELVNPAAVATYFRKVGDDRAAQRFEKKCKRLATQPVRKRKLAAAVEEADVEIAGAALLPERSSASDLDAVSCRTHKETPSMTREHEKSAGLLVSCLSSGVVPSVREILGCESLSQRYMFVADLKELYPELSTVVHDDACHLHRFARARGDVSAVAGSLAPPNMCYVCDIFHMAGHVDPWCLEHCNPRAPCFESVLAGVRTSVCEFTFTWLSQYKHQTKHMSEFGFKVRVGGRGGLGAMVGGDGPVRPGNLPKPLGRLP